jgi:hypothetical protein
MSDFECGGFSRFDNIRTNAYWTRVHLDTKLFPSVYGREDYVRHIQDCIDHPTTGLIARSQYITRKPMNYPEYASRNKLVFEHQPEVEPLIKEFNKKMKKLYKRTMYARKYIIDDGRISLDTVTRACKYTKFDRTVIFLKKLFHKF